MLSRTKIILVLIVSYDRSRLNGVLAILIFVDHSLNLIISFLDHQPLLVLTTLILVASSRNLLNPCLSIWGWPSGLDHNSKIQEFCYTSGVLYKLLRDSPLKNFFLQVISCKKEEKSSTDELPPRGVQDLPLSFFCPTSCSNQESKGFFCQRATYKGKYGKAKEAIEFARADLLPQKKESWESQEKEKKRKRLRKARRWLQRRQGSVCPTRRIPFVGSRVFGHRSGPSRLKYRLLQDLVYEEAMCEGSSGNGLLYAVKQYLKRTTLRTYSAKAVP
jgi:hypothetical protein